MQIVVRQTSGLGNQLFQYAAGRCLANKLGGSLRIAHELPKKLTSYGSLRPVQLHKFAISAVIGKVTAFDRLILSTRPELALLGRAVRALRKIQVIREDADAFLFHKDFQLASESRIVYLLGYWQAYSIVRDVEPELRQELAPVSPLSGRSFQVAEKIRNAANAVSIHLRRGDYQAVFGPNSVLSAGYYERAIRLMAAKAPDSTFFVFSDDIEYAREWARGDQRLNVVDHNDANTAFEDIQLMSLCRRHIIANSSFSWWGAWMNSKRDREVVAPSKWLGFDTKSTDIAFPGWTLVDP